MPREHIKRGKRGAKKRKRDDEDDQIETKRRRLEVGDPTSSPEEGNDAQQPLLPSGFSKEDIPQDPLSQAAPFFGLLDHDEQDYFRRIHDLLEADEFESEEERCKLIESTLKEAEGKELKIACSQGPSRLMDKLLLSSTSDTQFFTLVEPLLKHWLHLSTHRFASHSCEAVFKRANSLSRQVAFVSTTQVADDEAALGEAEVDVSIRAQRLIKDIVGQLQSQYGFLLDHKFGSHVLRQLLTCLHTSSSQSAGSGQSKPKAGRPAEPQPEKVTSDNYDPGNLLRSISQDISQGLDASTLRALVSRPYAGPVLQLLLSIELSQMRTDQLPACSVYNILFEGGFELPDAPGRRFLNGMLFDSIGSHLIEALVEHADGKTFKKIYRHVFKNEMGRLSAKDVAAFVVIKILDRVGKDDLEQCRDQILKRHTELRDPFDAPQVLVLRTLVERSAIRNLPTEVIGAYISNRTASRRSSPLLELLRFQSPASISQVGPQSEEDRKNRLNRSLLAQAICRLPGGRLSDLIFEELDYLHPQTLWLWSTDPINTYLVQAMLESPAAAPAFRRKLISSIMELPPSSMNEDGQMVEGIICMAINPTASHVLDKLVMASCDLPHLRQRIGAMLAEGEAVIKESPSGRSVWRNWSMDLYQKSVPSWLAKTAGSHPSSSQNAGKVSDDSQPGRTGQWSQSSQFAASKQPRGTMSALQLAARRFAANQKQKARSDQRRATAQASS